MNAGNIARQGKLANFTPSRLITRYPSGFAWPAGDDRFGRYIMCPSASGAPFELGVVDDFGHLVHVPSSVGIFDCCVHPSTGMLA